VVDVDMPEVAESPVRRVVGRPAVVRRGRDQDARVPHSLRELAFLDRVNEIGKPDSLAGPKRLPDLDDEDYAVLALLDRIGLVPATVIRRAVQPDRAPGSVAHRLRMLYRHGLVSRHETGLLDHTRRDDRPPRLYSITRRGFEAAQLREPSSAIPASREWRQINQSRAARFAHDLRAASWAIAFRDAVGPLATDYWRTRRYATGRYQVPCVGLGQDRHVIRANELPVDSQAIVDLQLATFAEIKPDISLEIRTDALQLTFDVLVELDLTDGRTHNRDKFLAYDAFLTGWALAHSRYREQQTRPAVVFVCRDYEALHTLAYSADDAMTARIGATSTPAEFWYYAGRDHLFFALEADIHHGRLDAVALPSCPPGLREPLTGTREMHLERVDLLPYGRVGAARRR
jgi:hypothetical protein